MTDVRQSYGTKNGTR